MIERFNAKSAKLFAKFRKVKHCIFFAFPGGPLRSLRFAVPQIINQQI